MSALLRGVVYAGAAVTSLVLAFVVGYILVNGVPYLTPSLFEWEYDSTNVSLMPALVNTLVMAGLSLLMAVPVGVGSAIYLVEYARRGSRLVKAVRMTSETLSGIPSIVYGLFGYLCFVVQLKWSYSLLSGACTLAIMILPSIISVSATALNAVPREYEEASLALGATHIETVFRVSVPAARCGIATAIVLGIGRAIGVNGGGVDNVARVLGPAQISPQIAQFIELTQSLTQTNLGATSVALGEAKPDNTSAIIALPRAPAGGAQEGAPFLDLSEAAHARTEVKGCQPLRVRHIGQRPGKINDGHNELDIRLGHDS